MKSSEPQNKEVLAHNSDVFSPLSKAPVGPSHKVLKTLGICHEGWPFVGLGFLITCITFAFSGGWAIIPGILFLWVMWFFRDPTRDRPYDENILLSPADGTVIEAGVVQKSPWMQEGELREYHRIAIFMSVFNVHVNRIPCRGIVQKLAYNKGKFLSAFKEKASLENEQMAVWIARDKGKPILIVQIAGLIARRIVCKLVEKEPVAQGMKFGLIRFGSRMEVYLPRDEFNIQVKKGQSVKAGETVLAKK